MSVLEKLTQLEKEAEQFGFQWENAYQIMAQIKSECKEIEEELTILNSKNNLKLQEEIGDLLHAVFSLCIFCEFNATDTLNQSVNKFEKRLSEVKKMSREQGIESLKGFSFEVLMKMWEDAKKRVG